MSSKKLMIVESPNKIKKIKSILGSSWEVSASVGHIRDLPNNEMGFEPPYFKPTYVVSSDKHKVVKQLRSLTSKSSEVYLATDPDREGEAIAFHLAETLSLKNPKRVTFNEITKSAINDALNNVTTIDQNLVFAQEARRVLDRMVGYSISPILSAKSGTKLSAGRVQSPAVKLVVFREREIDSFLMRNYYLVEITLDNGLTATLDPKPWAENKKHIFDRTLIEKIALIDQVVAEKVDQTEKSIKPRPPFTTSSLQQSASSHLNMSPSDTMKNAQALFEQGAITYHRTDTPNLSVDGFDKMKDYLESNNLDFQDTQLKWNVKGSAQEAHEAIRPTDPFNDAGENQSQRDLYQLIKERALASAMPPAIDFMTTITFSSLDEITHLDIVSHAKLIFTGKVEKYKGWREIAKLEPPSFKENPLNVTIEEGKKYSCSSKVIDKKTEPPARFTEASLIKALEKLEIGRPSTYASILENIKNRGYVQIEKKGKGKGILKPTDLGVVIVDSLENMTFMNFDYTRLLEGHLDKIAVGKSNYLSLVKSVYHSLESESKSITVPLLIETQECPGCGKPLKRIKTSKSKDYFWVHCDENHAKDCQLFISDKNGKPFLQKEETATCPKCNNPLVRKYSKSNDFHFWVHKNESDIVDCQKFISDKDGKPSVEKEV